MEVLDTPAVAARNDEQELTALLAALNALRRGDATVRLPHHWEGIAGKVADAFNEVVEQNAAMAEEHAKNAIAAGAPGWSAVRAVKEGKVVALEDESILRPGPRIADGLAVLARAIHPEVKIP